jgi:hypothetical protein
MADRIAVDEEENKRQRLENERKRMKEVDLLSKILPDTKSQTKEMAGIQTQANALIDPKLYTDMTVNWRATAALMGKPLDELDATQYGDYKAQIAVKLNKPAPKSESEYRSMLSEYFVKEKGKDTALNELYGNVVLKAFQDTGMGKNRAMVGLPTEYVKQWEEQHKDLIGGDAGFHAQANRVYNQTLKDIESIRGKGAETFSALMDFTQGKADDERIAQVAEHLSSSTPEERQKVYSYIGLAAEAGHIDRAGIEQFAINMGQSFSRGFDFIPQGTLQLQEDAFREMRDTLATGKVWLRRREGTPTLNDVFRPSQAVVGSAINIDMTGREATPEEVATLKAEAEKDLKTFGVIRELRNAAKSSVDPIRPVFEDSAIERGAYGLAGSLGIMVPVAINPAIGMLAYQAQEYDRIMLENPDIDSTFAKGLSLVEGAGNAALDRLQLGAINGKLPVFGGLLNGIKNNGIRRVLTTVGVEILEQNLQEGAQDLIAPLTETMAAALREDMPDKDFGELMKDYVGSRAETFFAVLPLALLGGGIGTYRDLKNPAMQLADKQLAMAGFGPAQRDYINQASSLEEKATRVEQEWSKRTEQDIAAGKEQLAASIAEARSQKAGDTVEVNTKADGTSEWIVRDPAGKEVARVASEDEAVTIIADRGEAEIKSQANVVADLLDSDWRKDKLPNFEAQFGGEVTPEQLLKDAEAKGDKKLVESIKASIEAHGNDPAELSKLRILGESWVTPYAEGQYKAFVKLNEGSTAQDAFEEIVHNIFDIDIAEGRITKEQAREWVSQTAAAGVAGYKFGTDAEVRESMAQIAQDFARNKIDQTNLPSSFVAFLKKLYTEFVEFMRRAKLLDQAFAEGKIDAEFERYLSEKIGLSDATMIEREVNRIEGEQGGGQQLDLFQDSRATPEAGADVRTVGDTKIVGPTSFAIRAYHGTPHEVDRFSTEKIGTGEGAQVYGWGLYFAQNRNVAQNYKERLTNGTLILDGVSAMENRTKTGNLIWGHASEYFASGYKTKETLLGKLNNARKFEKDGGNKYFPDSDYIQVIDALENTIELSLRDEGNLYTVELDAEDHELLDWDKPLSEQSEEVRKALESIIKDRTATEIADSYLKEATAQGATIYQLVAGSFGEREGKNDIAQASEAMASLGIKGIRYLDQGSRWKNIIPIKQSDGYHALIQLQDGTEKSVGPFQTADEASEAARNNQGTHNFVIFDGKHIQITEKNGQPVSVEDVPVDGDTSFSIRARDEAYDAAVKAGDEAEQQRLVDEAAKEAGYEVGPVYHGTPTGGFDVFREQPTYFAGEKADADIYQSSTASSIRVTGTPDGTPETKKVFLKADNVFDTRKPKDRKRFEKEFLGKSGEEWGSNGTPIGDRGLPDWTDGRDLVDWIQEEGLSYDALALDEGGFPQSDGTVRVKGASVVVWKPHQIKSADPITRNEAGNVIPLSQRFNSESNDIRFSIREVDEAQSSAEKSNDLDAGQRLADAVAKVGGYEVKAAHGSSVRFNKFSHEFGGYATDANSAKGAFFFSDGERTPRAYAVFAAEEGPIKELMRKADQAEAKGDWDAYDKFIQQAEEMSVGEMGADATRKRRENASVYNVYLKGKFLEMDAEGMTPAELSQAKQFEEFDGSITAALKDAKAKGYDGVVIRNLDDAPNLTEVSTHYAVFDPSNIKLSDPFTYDDNGELIPLSKRFDQTNEDIRFSIQSQAQIDRVNKAVADTTQFAEGRMALYERAKERFKAVLAENKDILDALKEGGTAPEKIRRAKLIQGIAELEVILRQLPAEVRGKVGGFGVLARGGTGDTFLANFFRDRVRMIDEQLEKYLSNEYDEELYRIFERAKPKKDKPGEKPKGIGADIQDLFAKVKEAQRWSAEEINAHLAAIDSRIDSEDLSPSDEARLIREADLIGLVGGWRNKDSNAKAHAIATLKETWAKGYYNFILKKTQEKEQREADRMEAIAATGKEGVLAERQEADKKENGWKGKFKKGYFNLIGWDQFVSVLFGEKSDIATRLANGERNANSQKEDATQSKMDEISKFFAGLAGKDKLKGEQLRWKMAQKSLKPFEGTRWSNLEFSEMEAVAATMLWMQEDGKRHMIGKLDDGGKPISAWNYTQEFVDLLEANLSKEAKALRDFLLKKYDTEYDSINKVYKALNGINLPKIANYSPVTVAPVNAPAGTAIDPVTGGVMAARGTSPGALRTRGQAIAEPKFQDALQTYIAHTKQMEHWKAYAPFMAEANGILRNRDVQNAIEAKGGKEAKAVLNTWTDLFSQGGVRSAEAQLGLSKDISEAGGRAARVALVGRIGTIIIQSTQLGAALAEMPTGAYILRMSKLLSGNLGWKAAFESDYIQRRLNEMPPIVRQAVEGLKSDRPNVVKSAVEKLGRLISGADALFTAGTYAITYDYHLKQAKQMGIPSPEAYAKGVAERAVDKLAQPTRMGARSVIENTSTGLIRNFWAFASESRKNLGLAAYAINVQDPARIGRTLVSLVVLNSLLGNVIRNAWSDARDDDDDEWFDEKHWGLKRMLASTMVDSIQVRGIPVLGDAISTGFYDAVNQYHQTGSLINFGGFIRAMKHIPKYAEGDADWEMTFKDIDGILSVGGLFNESIAAVASLSHLATDAFGVSKNAKKAVTGD